jgi:hypothetical protein
MGPENGSTIPILKVSAAFPLRGAKIVKTSIKRQQKPILIFPLISVAIISSSLCNDPVSVIVVYYLLLKSKKPSDVRKIYHPLSLKPQGISS